MPAKRDAGSAAIGMALGAALMAAGISVVGGEAVEVHPVTKVRTKTQITMHIDGEQFNVPDVGTVTAGTVEQGEILVVQASGDRPHSLTWHDAQWVANRENECVVAGAACKRVDHWATLRAKFDAAGLTLPPPAPEL